MKVELKTWGRLGLATALAGAGLAGCAEQEAAEGGDAAQVGQVGEDGESGGEGGESGEGGIAFDEAARNPVVYRSGLAVAEAHAIAARDALSIGRREAAAQMFAHPVSEVLAEMGPVFEQLGVTDFSALFTEASDAVLEGADQNVIAERYEAIIAAIREAETKAPNDGASPAMVAAGVISDQIGRANAMYRISGNTDAYEPYLDGYGFFMAAQETFARTRGIIESEDAELARMIEDALTLQRAAFPGAERPNSLTADQDELVSAHNRIRVALS